MNIKKPTLNLVVLACIVAVLLSCSSQGLDESYDTSIDLSLVEENNWTISEDILLLINNHRIENNLNLLSIDSTYASAYAVNHTKYMVDTQTVNHDNFFIRSNGLKQRGAIEVSENVAYGYSSPESVVNAWLNSEGHRVTIEGDFSSIGFGVIKSEINNRYYYTTIYFK